MWHFINCMIAFNIMLHCYCFYVYHWIVSYLCQAEDPITSFLFNNASMMKSRLFFYWTHVSFHCKTYFFKLTVTLILIVLQIYKSLFIFLLNQNLLISHITRVWLFLYEKNNFLQLLFSKRKYEQFLVR